MLNAKLVNTRLAVHFRFSSVSSPQLDAEVDYMSCVPYSNAMGSLMYIVVCSPPYLSYAISRYMANSGKEHWNILSSSSDACLHLENMRDVVIRYVDFDYAGDLK